jgi:hypothetical protein
MLGPDNEEERGKDGEENGAGPEQANVKDAAGEHGQTGTAGECKRTGYYSAGRRQTQY